jgi:hypothetical protein
VYKTDVTFIAPKLKTPGTVPPNPVFFMIGREAIYSLYPRPKAHVNTQKKLHFSWMCSGIGPSPKSSVPVRLLLVLHHVVVSGKQTAHVDANIWAVTFSLSSFLLDCLREETFQTI